ncbi:nuclear transport factor 2 family protein [Ohtaekwangia koreensis]|uniref:Ketosteroid isomerase-related protein n=1 Tax=Ohtaekwangia koreensis TaxID=688867 RepID=A0A1T5JPL2_9BACT|nr:nuclear transport factor 2 family protein [Ohtaekwangia koreensis]SKC53223.1 Ketosteroid isomerase-related protein [Ohtaekwangia koreensis]
MEQHELLIRQFYTAFQKRDYAAMQECYHADASFHDPVFQDLNAKQVRAMWQMLLTSSKDLKVSFSDIHIAGDTGTCTWEAWYTFSKTGKPVHNVINASFQFKDGKIFQHHDSFDLWRWSKQALGLSGLLLGWSPMVQNKIRATAKHSLAKFMSAS